MTPDAHSSASRTSLRRRLDQLGIGLAGLCVLHCLATLLVVSALGLGGHFLLDENIHRIGLLLALIVAALAIGRGMLRYGRRGPFYVALGGLALMGIALLVPHGTNEFLLTLTGVAIVAAAHWMNLRSPD
ncbi:MAG: MerC domain-containing protein [Erythrobacter sp.]|uniref:MerC domain-containing protein n=1 Tax=Erythrobacter sp. TaxID=1042 RepID=UPI0025DA1AA8|nr:MerC domain-containing protein [Erythrobacter sp.]MCL9997966.1 MerC domain-containing protein [Erythrobacter sp.]